MLSVYSIWIVARLNYSRTNFIAIVKNVKLIQELYFTNEALILI